MRWVKPWFMTLASHIRVPVRVPAILLPIQFPAKVPGKQQIMIQVLGPLLATWETQMELLAPDFSLVLSQLLRPFGE